MKSRYIISAAGAILASAMLFSCTQPAREIVEFDPTYGLDPAKTQVDIPEAMEYNPNNIVTISSNPEAVVQLFYDAKSGAVEGDEAFEVSLRMRRALENDVTLKFVEDRALLADYTGDQLGFVDLPDGVIDDFSIVIPAGQTVVQKRVDLKDIDGLKQLPGYLTAYKMELVGAPADLVVSNVGHKLFLKVKVDEAAKLEVSSANPTGNAIIAYNVTVKSNFRQDRTEAISDGMYDQFFPEWTPDSWWVENKSDTWLTLDFPTSNVTGFKLYTLDPGNKSKTIKSMRVQVSSDNGRTYTDYGTITIPNVRRSFSLVFIRPMNINQVRFSEFDGYSTDPNDPWIDIHEIMVFQE